MRTKHILIVDDEPKVAFFLSKALERSGQNYRVETTQSGEEALEVLSRTSVDLLVTDLRMPGISGLDLIRRVRASSPQTRTILITAYGSDEVETEARRLEAYRYITKPFDIGDFTEAVQGALGDVAISQPGLTVLSDKTFDAITQQLDNLRQDIGARCILLADMQGQCLATVGYTEDLKSATLLALLAGGFATSGELAHQFGDEEAVNLNFYQGTRHEIYSANVGENLFVALVYDRETQASRIGIVWLYTQRMIERLLPILSTARDEPAGEAMDAGFGSAVMTELDTLFSEEPTAPTGSQTASQTAPPTSSPPTPAQRTQKAPKEAPSKPLQHRKEKMGKSKQELFSLEEAIERGLLPQDFGK